MKDKNKYILFLSNSGNRAGANIVLYNYTLSLIEKKEFKPIFLFQNSGLMIEEFRKIGPVYINSFVTQKRDALYKKIRYYCRKFLRLDEYSFAKVFKELKKYDIKLIYSNTIHNENAIRYLHPKLNVPLIIHSHEQDYIIKIYKGNPNFDKQFLDASNLISVSKASSLALLNNFDIPQGKINEIYPGINIEVSEFYDKDSSRKQLNISDNIFVVLGMGTPHWIKGCDLFFQVAMQTVKKDKDIVFYWVGGDETNSDYKNFKNDITKSGYGKNIILINHTTNPLIFHSASDLFLLSSRVDSFPLVNLQSGLFKVPVICFEKSGGSEEIINEATGFVVPYADAKEMSEKILFLKNNSEILKQKGEKLHEIVLKNYNCELMNSKIQAVISKTMVE